MHQIEELLGDTLSDPEERLTMKIALRARQLLAREEPPVHLVEEEDRLPVVV